MISAVSNVSFRGEGSSDIINAPSKYSAQPSAINPPADSFEKADKEKKSGWKALLGVAIVALAAFAGLGYAVKTEKLVKVEAKELENAGFFGKVGAYIKNAGYWVGEKAQSCYEGVAGLFSKETKEAAKPTADA
jgi:hypothetical protein